MQTCEGKGEKLYLQEDDGIWNGAEITGQIQGMPRDSMAK